MTAAQLRGSRRGSPACPDDDQLGSCAHPHVSEPFGRRRAASRTAAVNSPSGNQRSLTFDECRSTLGTQRGDVRLGGNLIEHDLLGNPSLPRKIRGQYLRDRRTPTEPTSILLRVDRRRRRGTEHAAAERDVRRAKLPLPSCATFHQTASAPLGPQHPSHLGRRRDRGRPNATTART